MQKKNRRHQRTKRVGGGLTSFLRSCSSEPYIVQFVEKYKQAGESDDKPKHQKRFMEKDAPKLMEYFQKLNGGEEPCGNEKAALATVKDLISKKEEFHANYGIPDSLNSNFSKMFMELARVVNPVVVSESFESKNPFSTDDIRTNVGEQKLLNDVIRESQNAMRLAEEEEKRRLAEEEEENKVGYQQYGETVGPDSIKPHENPLRTSGVSGPKLNYGVSTGNKSSSLTKKPLNISTTSEDLAQKEVQQMEAERTGAERTEGGAKKSRRRRNQRRNRSRKQ